MSVRQRKIPAEYMGLARQWLRTVETLPAYGRELRTIMDRIAERGARHPHRHLPTALLADIIRQWERAGDGPARFYWKKDLTRSGKRGMVSEVRLVRGNMNRPGWEEKEPVVEIMFARLEVTRKGDTFSCSCEHYVGLHAIARYIQRTGERDHERITLEVMRAVKVRPENYECGVRVDCDHWRGIVTDQMDPDEWPRDLYTPPAEQTEGRRGYLVRTWIENPDEED